MRRICTELLIFICHKKVVRSILQVDQDVRAKNLWLTCRRLYHGSLDLELILSTSFGTRSCTWAEKDRPEPDSVVHPFRGSCTRTVCDDSNSKVCTRDEALSKTTYGVQGSHLA